MIYKKLITLGLSFVLLIQIFVFVPAVFSEQDHDSVYVNEAFDNLETKNYSSFPVAGMQAVCPAQNWSIVDEPSKEDKSLQLHVTAAQAAAASFKEARYLMNAGMPDDANILMETRIKIKADFSAPDNYFSFGPWVDGTSQKYWWNHAAKVRFFNGQVIKFGGKDIGTWVPGKWYDIKLRCQPKTGILTAYIQGEGDSQPLTASYVYADLKNQPSNYVPFQLRSTYAFTDAASDVTIQTSYVKASAVADSVFEPEISVEGGGCRILSESIIVPSGTTAGALKAQIQIQDGWSIKMYDEQGELKNDSVLKNRDVLKATQSDSSMLYKRYIIYTTEAVEDGALVLKYDEPAEDSINGWKNASLPLGNGYMGANVFGLTDTERIQLTENSLWTGGGGMIDNRYHHGLENFAEVYVNFGHDFEQVKNYDRCLSLSEALANVSYEYNGTQFSREYFTSYPDKVMVMRFTADRKELNFTLKPTVPDIRETLNDIPQTGKSGTVLADGDTITLSGHSEYYGVDFEGQFKVRTDGNCIASNDNGGQISVSDASYAEVIVAVGTNYELYDEEVFIKDNNKKLEGKPHPHEKVTGYIRAASGKTYDALKGAHKQDYQNYFDRVKLQLGGTMDGRSTDQLIESYRQGNREGYLEELYYQMGRYLLISSSRKGCLPSNLQGIWNAYEVPPWSSGYWYNVNVEMNYWPVFTTNLKEMFESFADYNTAKMKRAENIATEYVKKYAPDRHVDGQGRDGWIVATDNNPYAATVPGMHSGVGTGGFATTAYVDWYDFVKDDSLINSEIYPTLEGMARFYTKFVSEKDGLYLADPSYSPEQRENNEYYETVGCAFDQQMIYNNNKALLDLYDSGKVDPEIADTELIETVRGQIEKYDPVQIGLSGQVKEFREEKYYGDIGEEKHRHVSQLVGLYPGTVINQNTPAWVDGAAQSLLGRKFDISSGWSEAHKLNLWARIGNEENAYYMLQSLISNHLFDNLWNSHDKSSNKDAAVFQIEGNFGATAGITEMLLQSHGGSIDVLPALPQQWDTGSYSGLVARGNFEVGVEWSGGQAQKISITSNSGGKCTVHYPNIKTGSVKKSSDSGSEISPAVIDGDTISFDTVKGETYIISGMPRFTVSVSPAQLTVDDTDCNNVALNWTEADPGSVYNVYRALVNAPDYELLQSGVKDTSYCDHTKGLSQATYKVTAVSGDSLESKGVTRTIPETPGPVSGAKAFRDGTRVQMEWESVKDAQTYKVYQKSGDSYLLLGDTKDCIYFVEQGEEDAVYAVSVVCDGRESAKTDMVPTEGLSKLELYQIYQRLTEIENGGYNPDDVQRIAQYIQTVKAAMENENATADEIREAVRQGNTALALAESFVRNVARNKPITVSPNSAYPNYPNTAINDGSRATRYASGVDESKPSTVTFEIDLQGSYLLRKFALSDYRGVGKDTRTDRIKIEGFSAGAWQVFVDQLTTGGTQSGDVYTTEYRLSVPQDASKLKVTCTNDTPDDGEKYKSISIYEFEAYAGGSESGLDGLVVKSAKLSAGSIIEMKLRNYSKEPIAGANDYIAFYGTEDHLLSMQKFEFNMDADSISTVRRKVDVPQNAKYAKIFIWTETLQPLSDVYPLNIHGA